MTGYGRHEAGERDLRFTVEVRSLNNRFLDVQIRSPRSLAPLETRIRKSVPERFSRGRFDLFITRSGGQERSGRIAVNEDLARQYLDAFRQLKERFGLAGDADLPLLAALPDVVTVNEADEDHELLWRALAAALAPALEALDRMRKQEGAVLAADMLARLDVVERLIAAIRTKAPDAVKAAQQRMTESLARLLREQPDPGRVAQEIAILAERVDITEELTRLGSHLVQFRDLLHGRGREGVGRRLDFLLQEMGRETNTIASKAMDAAVSLDVVGIKAELEKIREQAQNIE